MTVPNTPKHPPMTFREAVDIVSRGFDGYAESDVWAKWDRARAIVDQAGKFIAYCRDGADEVDDSMLCEDWKKLRALERGEVQP